MQLREALGMRNERLIEHALSCVVEPLCAKPEGQVSVAAWQCREIQRVGVPPR